MQARRPLLPEDRNSTEPVAGQAVSRPPSTRGRTVPAGATDPGGQRSDTATRAAQGRITMTGADAGNQHDLLNRLSRIEGQVRGISRMVDADAPCIDILTQVSAARRALECVALRFLDDHTRQCLIQAARLGGAEQDHKFKEASEAIARLVRS